MDTQTLEAPVETLESSGAIVNGRRIYSPRLRIGKWISNEELEAGRKAYKEGTWKANSERIGKEDSKKGCYTIFELERFLQDAKRLGAAGIQFEYTTYTEETAPTPEHVGIQAFAMVGINQDPNGIIREVWKTNEDGTRSIVAYNALCVFPEVICPPAPPAPHPK